MSLTTGTGPFASGSRGSFDNPAPDRPLLFWEPFGKRLRVVLGGDTVVDSRDVVAVHETGQTMRLAVPHRDVRVEKLTPTIDGNCPGGRLGSLQPWSLAEGEFVALSIEAAPERVEALQGMFLFELEKADAWYLEDDLGYAHPRDPYHRVDVQRSSRRVIVRAGVDVIAESSAPALLFETSLPPLYYLPPDAVRHDCLEKSETVSQCPYKGDGQHWHVILRDLRIEDALWSLTAPLGDALMIPRWFGFYADKLSIEVDGVRI